MGGRGKVKDIYPKLAKEFPNLTKAELDKWKNRVRWVRQQLIDRKGELASAEYGVWEITPEGRKRLELNLGLTRPKKV